MISSDEEPEAFAAHLRDRLAVDDEEVLNGFRAALRAALEAVSVSAQEPIALMARQYLKGECEQWIARAWLRVLTEVSDVELGALRELIDDAFRRAAPRQPAGYTLPELNDALFPLTPSHEIDLSVMLIKDSGDRLFSILDASYLVSIRWRGGEEQHRSRSLYLPQSVVLPIYRALRPDSP